MPLPPEHYSRWGFLNGLYSVSRRQARSLTEVDEKGAVRLGHPFCIFEMYKAVVVVLVIDLADDGQVETLGHRVNVYDELRVTARALESARASDEVEESLIDTRDWIEDSVDLNEQLISVGGGECCFAAGMEHALVVQRVFGVPGDGPLTEVGGRAGAGRVGADRDALFIDDKSRDA